MVYEKKCSECGKVLDFGGRKDRDRTPENGLRFDGELYCKECVKRFVEFGTGNIQDRMEKLEDTLRDVAYEVGIDLKDL